MEIGTLCVILAMSLVTLATRWGGIAVMSWLPFGDRMKRLIEAMSGSVLVALLAPLAVTGDHGARLALLTTTVIVLLCRKPMPAIAAGVLAAALFRQV